MPDGHSHSEYRHKSLESGVMRKYHAPFGGRPTEKGSIQSTSPAAHPTQSPAVEPHTLRHSVYWRCCQERRVRVSRAVPFA